MAPQREHKNCIARYHLTQENLISNVRERLENYDLLDVVMLRLGDEGQGDFRRPQC